MKTMNRILRSIPLFLLLLAALTATTPAAAAQRDPTEPASFRTVQYEIHYMDLHAAEVLAWDQCPDALKNRCQVSAMSTQDSRIKHLDVTADGPTHERISRALSKADSAPRTQVFQAVLLAANNRPGGAPPELTPGAQKALGDIRGFLPYKSYEQLDAVWLRTTQVADGRLVGRDGRQYKILLRFRPAGADSKDLFVDQFYLRQEMTISPGKGAPPYNQKDLITTSFGLKQGETIVVGTSKSDDGDEALVLLLTAAP
jgi:hypothetical protein